jgi:hypothetical protein
MLYLIGAGPQLASRSRQERGSDPAGAALAERELVVPDVGLAVLEF